MDPVLDLVVRAGLALLFAAAAAHKLVDLPRFRATLADYELVPAPAVTPASIAIVAAEIGLVLALLRPGGRTPALTGGAALLASYAIAIAVNLLRGRVHLDCGCLAASGRRTISWWMVTRNAVLVGAASAALVPVAARPLGWIDAITVLGALATAVLAWTATDGLVANLPGVGRIRGAM